MADNKGLTPRSEDFSAWYNEVVQEAELADYSPVRGSMVIRPWGYGIWENMQKGLDGLFKDTGHENAYFPLLIPMSFIEREKEHVEGFAPELAIVTQAGGKELEEHLAIRPTSETIIYHMYAKWVQSYRDLPILMNQWCNVIRWEMRTRLFLRTAEFLWQEGHTAHATKEEAEAETLQMLGIYRKFMEEWVAMPPVTGVKTESEKFAGGVRSHATEALMQDNKALQAGTSHFLGQNFAKQFDLKFQSEAGQEEYAWNTSWGVSTRLIGGLVMTHGDDVGAVVPPRLAPTQVVVIPISRKEEERGPVREKAEEIAARLKDQGVRVKVDARDHLTPGAKFWEWERKGAPFRVEIGPKDLAKEQAVLVRRVTFGDEDRKEFLPEAEVVGGMTARLDAFQDALLAAAIKRREENSYRGVKTLAELKEIMDGPGGFVYTGWDGDPAVEEMVKEETKATIRVIPDEEFRSETAPDTCIGGGKSKMEVVWSKAY
ncbi:proline--tRNA ligase [Gemmatimonadota bacterium]